MRYYYTYYPQVRELTIPDANAIGTFGPLDVPSSDRDRILQEAFSSPVNSEPLSKLASSNDRVVIVTDDALEPTPTVFPFFYVIQELHKAGVPDSNISVIIANAGHRINSNEEVDRKIGAEMHRKYHVFQSAMNERSDSYHTFGTTEFGGAEIRASIDARLRDATLIVGLTGTYPNRFKGYSGAGSLLFPGLGDEQMMGTIYLAGAEQPVERVLGHMETPARALIRELTQFIPAFQFCVDLVIDASLHIAACVTGSPSSVYRVSADVAGRIYHVPLPEKADIIVTDSHPFDLNLFQAFHALYGAACAVKSGGEIIVVTPLLEPLSNHAAALAASLKESRDNLLRYSREGYLSRNAAAGAQLSALREVIEHTSRITFVTHGKGSQDVDNFGFHRADDLQRALNQAIERKGENARVALLTHGGLTVPR